MCHEKSWRTKCGVDGLDLGRQEDTTVVKQQGSCRGGVFEQGFELAPGGTRGDGGEIGLRQFHAAKGLRGGFLSDHRYEYLWL